VKHRKESNMSSEEEKSAVTEILRTLSDDKAFYFFRSVDSPLGLKARSLEEFLEQLKVVDADSVRFHLARHDFQNWLLMLGDVSLAKQISGLDQKGLSPPELQLRLVGMVRMRLEKLRRVSS